MPRRAHRPEQIIQKLRQAEIEISKGATVPHATTLARREREIAVTIP